MNKLFFAILALIVVACGCKHEVVYKPVNVPGPVVIKPPPAVELTDIQKIVAEKNDYRVKAGQLPLTPGLTCTLHVTSDPDLTHALPSAANTFTLLGSFNQPAAPVTDGLNTIPLALRPLYINGFVQRCQGQLVITESGYYSFELTSDDASMLYIDGSLVISNNGAHGPTLVVGSKLLERGVHTFKLDFSQSGGGTEELLLTSDGVVIPAENFYR